MTGQPEPACGRSYDDLLAAVADGLPDDAHQAGCASCQAALVQARLAWSPVRALSREQVVAPAGLTRSVLARVRAGHTAGSLTLATTGPGTTRVADRVLVRLAQQAAVAVPDVLEAAVRSLTPPGPGGPGAGDRRPGPAVEVALTARYGARLPALAAWVRREVRADLAAATGLVDVRVDVVVDDVTDDGAAGTGPTEPARQREPARPRLDA